MNCKNLESHINNSIFGRFTANQLEVYIGFMSEASNSIDGFVTIPIKVFCHKLAIGHKTLSEILNFLSYLGLVKKLDRTLTGCFRYQVFEMTKEHDVKIIDAFKDKDRLEVIKRLSSKIKN